MQTPLKRFPYFQIELHYKNVSLKSKKNEWRILLWFLVRIVTNKAFKITQLVVITK